MDEWKGGVQMNVFTGVLVPQFRSFSDYRLIRFNGCNINVCPSVLVMCLHEPDGGTEKPPSFHFSLRRLFEALLGPEI